MQVHELACRSMSLYAVPWDYMSCMQFHELVCSFFFCLSSSQEFRSACCFRHELSVCLYGTKLSRALILFICGSYLQKLTCWSLKTGLGSSHKDLALYFFLWPCKNQKGMKNKTGWSDYRLVCILRNVDMPPLLFHHTQVSLDNVHIFMIWWTCWQTTNPSTNKPALWAKSFQDQLSGPYWL